MPTFFIPSPPPFPSFLKKKRPPNLNLTRINSSSTPSVSFAGTPSPFTPISICTTPEVKAFLAPLSIDDIENVITYNTENFIKNGQNGVVKTVTLFVQGKTRELVKKQGGFGVERENKMTEAIQKVTDANFPFDLFALPVAQGSDGTTNILYTCYQEIGDLQTHVEHIYNQYNSSPNAISYLFQGFQQLLEAINALDSSVFIDNNGQTHQGVIHNDIKPSNIFLKTNGDFILGDFGCAYFKDEAAPQISSFQFSAPELFINKEFCIKSLDSINSDLWSLGTSLWYLLTNQLLSPTLPTKKSLSDLEKILFYKDWAENYTAQWQALIKNCLNLTGEHLVKQIKNTIDSDLKNLQANFNDQQNTEQKKKILKKLALLMQAPASERPNVYELKELIDRLEDHFVIYGDAEEIAVQLLERKKNENPVYQESQNNNKLTFSR